MRRQTKILCFLLAFTFTLSFVTFPIAGAEEFEGKSAATIKDTKNPIYHYTLDDKFVPDRVIVSILHDYSELDKEYSPEDFPGVDVKSIGYLTPLLDPNGDYPYLNRDEYRQILLLFLDTSDKQHVLDMIDVLNENPIVRSAQVDLLGVQEFSVPNDEYYEDHQKEMYERMSIPEAWDITTGSSSVKVGIIDSGVNISHPDMTDNFLCEHKVTYLGFAEPSTTPHGSFVAGIIGAKGNNSIGVAGVCWNVSMISIKVIDYGSFDNPISGIIQGINYATAQRLPIVNLSMGVYSDTDPFADALKNFDGLLVCAAGNASLDTDQGRDGKNAYPACSDFDNVISVANCNIDDELDPSSNYGANSVDIAAIGTGVMSTHFDGTYAHESKGSGYYKLFHTGTSYSAPFVSGTAALLLSKNPNLTAVELKKAIVDSADHIPAFEGKLISEGRLNAYAALNYVTSGSKIRNYKVSIRKGTSVGLSFFNLPVVNDMSSCFYEDYINSTMAKDKEISVTEMPNGTNILTFSGESSMASSGAIATFIYGSKMSSFDCSPDITLGTTYCLDKSSKRVYPTISLLKVLMGDANGDKRVDEDDYTRVMNYATGKISMTSNQIFAADVNNDGKTDLSDALLITQYVGNRIDKFV